MAQSAVLYSIPFPRPELDPVQTAAFVRIRDAVADIDPVRMVSFGQKSSPTYPKLLCMFHFATNAKRMTLILSLEIPALSLALRS